MHQASKERNDLRICTSSYILFRRMDLKYRLQSFYYLGIEILLILNEAFFARRTSCSSYWTVGMIGPRCHEIHVLSEIGNISKTKT